MDDLTETKVEPTAQPQPQDDGGTVKFVPPPPDLPVFNFTEIPIDLIKPNPWQPRKFFKQESLDELAASIREHGILQPLVVIPTNDGYYQLIVGERRLRASKLAGLTGCRQLFERMLRS